MHRIYGSTGYYVNRMESDHSSSRFPRPVTRCCTPDTQLSSERTIMGKRTNLNCCLELGDSFLYSIAGSCMLASVNFPSQPPLSSVLLSHPHTAILSEDMPRLRHRLRCRRGSSRRQTRRSPTSSSTYAATSSNSDSPSRAQRGRLHCSGHSFRSPTPLNPLAHSQTMHFSFNSSLNRPRVTASITVVFQETPQDMTPCSGQACSNEEAQILRHSADSVDLKNVEVKDAQDDASKGEAVQPSSKPLEMKNDTGHAQAEQLNVNRDAGNDSEKLRTGNQVSVVKVPSAIGKVIHSIEDLYKDEGEPNELWCRVVEAAPDE